MDDEDLADEILCLGIEGRGPTLGVELSRFEFIGLQATVWCWLAKDRRVGSFARSRMRKPNPGRSTGAAVALSFDYGLDQASSRLRAGDGLGGAG